MTRRLSILLLGLGLGLLATSVAADPPLVTPLPFDHARHRRSLKKVGLDCVGCHPVGWVSAADAPLVDPLPTPLEACHGCHLGTLPGAPRRVGGSCGSCHADRPSLIPQNHDAAWIQAHGDSAGPGPRLQRLRAPPACAATMTAVPWPFSRTDPAFAPPTASRHGWTRPAAAHIGDSCTACHQRGSLPW